MKVTLLSHTPTPEKVVACAAKLCYASVSADELYDGLTQEKSAEFVELLASYGHESPIEHVSFTFTIQGVSRALLAQIPGIGSPPSVCRASAMSGRTSWR